MKAPKKSKAKGAIAAASERKTLQPTKAEPPSHVPKLKGLKKEQVLKASAALLTHIKVQKAKSNSFIEEDELIYLVGNLVAWLVAELFFAHI